MKNILPILILIVLILPFHSGCEKIKQLPPEPYIEFRQFTMFDTIDPLGNQAKGGLLDFYFEDGDGDLGVLAEQADTINLLLTLYYKEEGVFIEADSTDDNRPKGYRIPYMEREGQNKTLQGRIEITFFYYYYTFDLTDTIKYDFYIKDRAGNESNIESTCEIPFSLDGACMNE